MADPTETDEQLQQRMEGLRQQALMEMQTNPDAVKQRLRARGATEEQIAGLFANVGIKLPVSPQPGQVVSSQSAQTMAVPPVQYVQPVAAPAPQVAVAPQATAPMSDEDILKGGMYVQPPQGTTAYAPPMGMKMGGYDPNAQLPDATIDDLPRANKGN
jgi:hypothetical protein|tara:strand:- start:2375 stop:2848 length:474 start_codon:yes stop_codon:yes gene_type:complete